MARVDEPRFSGRVYWSDEDGAFVAFSPEFEGISAFGHTYEEAVSELREALILAIETHREHGWPMPEPAPLPHYSGQFRLRLPKSLHAWLAETADREGVSLNTLVIEVLSRARGRLETTDQGAGQATALHRSLEGSVASGQEVLRDGRSNNAVAAR